MRAHLTTCGAGVLHRCIERWKDAGNGDSHDHWGPFSHILVGRRAVEAVPRAVAAQGKLNIVDVVVEAIFKLLSSISEALTHALSLQRYLYPTATL